MTYKKIIKDQIKVIGKEQRYNLTDPQASEKINLFWLQTEQEKLHENIPNLLQPRTALGLYTNYDKHGNYSLIICHPVSSLQTIPDGMVSYIIPTTHYAVFSVTGTFPQAITHFWQELWKESIHLGFQRSFTFDFEFYDQRFNENTPTMDMYIAIK